MDEGATPNKPLKLLADILDVWIVPDHVVELLVGEVEARVEEWLEFAVAHEAEVFGFVGAEEEVPQINQRNHD